MFLEKFLMSDVLVENLTLTVVLIFVFHVFSTFEMKNVRIIILKFFTSISSSRVCLVIIPN